jgi:radical SAM protein with 4Fe4S-binding SPASM domain
MRKQYLQVVKSQFAAGRYLWLPQQGIKYIRSYVSSVVGKPLTGPILGTVVATYRCNNRCFMCDSLNKAQDSEKSGLRELDTTAMLTILDEFAALGTTGVGFTGGEPLLRPDIFTLLRHSKDLGIVTHLNTNGCLLTPGCVEQLIETGVDSINISLDGATAETHEAARRVHGGFQRILDGVQFILEQRRRHHRSVTVNFVSVMSRNNVHEIKDLVKLAIEHHVDGIGFIPVHGFYPEFQSDRQQIMSDPAWMSTLDQTVEGLIAMKRQGSPIENSQAYLKLFKLCFRGKPLPIPCYAGYTSCVVDCYGDIFPCVPWNNWDRSVQNIRNTSLKAFWYSKEYENIRKIRINPCRDCFWNCHTEMNLLYSPFLRANQQG